MKKDIEFHVAESVQCVAVKEWDKDFLSQTWNVYILNISEKSIETILVVSRGASDTKKTATLRRNIGNLKPKSSIRIEFMTDELVGFTNEYMLTYFLEGKLCEKTFVFAPNSLSEDDTTRIELLDTEGVLAS